jgi:3-deoxy-D-manno-octulosonate 8-phosphate phosphatase (KDO 8-P phosphatase)
MNFLGRNYLNLGYFFKEFSWRRIEYKLSNIKLLILDIDGVLTDGGLWFDEKGEVTKRFCVKNGLGLKMLQKNNISIVFLSGSSHLSNKFRAEQLGIDLCFLGIKDKYQKVRSLTKYLNIPKEHIAYVGDDLNDLPAKEVVGLFLVPASANLSLLKKAHAVMHSKGGEGAVRELAERILNSKNKLFVLKEKGWRDKND